MRLFIKYLCVGVLLLVAPLVHADMNDEADANIESQAAAAAGKPKPGDPMQGARFPFSLGIDADYLWIAPENEFKLLTYGDRVGAQIYLAYRLRGILGFELGYNWTNDKILTFTSVPGQTYFGEVATKTITYDGEIRLKETYLDAYGHYRAAKKLELKYGVGLGWVRQTIKVKHKDRKGEDAVSLALKRVDGHTRMVYRFNIGAQTLFFKTIGGRIIGTYQTTSTVQAKGLNYGVNPHMFSNSFYLAVGLFWNVSGYYYFPDWT